MWNNTTLRNFSYNTDKNTKVWQHILLVKFWKTESPVSVMEIQNGAISNYTANAFAIWPRNSSFRKSSWKDICVKP